LKGFYFWPIYWDFHQRRCINTGEGYSIIER
jgi:hypothetical protein